MRRPWQGVPEDFDANDLKLPFRFVEAWHSVLLTLLAVLNFKAAIANAYCNAYRE